VRSIAPITLFEIYLKALVRLEVSKGELFEAAALRTVRASLRAAYLA
jgi:hypothetical protein